MTKRTLLSFLEPIDYECPNTRIDTKRKRAIKIDREGKSGLKNYLGMSAYKSCDYLIPYTTLTAKDKNILLVEVSDFFKQFYKLNAQVEELEDILKVADNKNIDDFKCIKQPKAIIQSEIRDKTRDSLMVLNRMREAFQIKKQRSVQLIIVLCDIKQTDIYVFEYLRDKFDKALSLTDLRDKFDKELKLRDKFDKALNPTDLKCALKPLISDVKVLNIEMFQQYIKKKSYKK